MSENIYAPERNVTDIKECVFYHTIELPGYGTIHSQWDLREGVDDYLGNVALKGKRVLEVGTASGFLCFEMEKRGADVVAYDLSDKHMWDFVPFGGKVSEEKIKSSREIIRRLNNGWWFAHNLLGSKARMVYGSVYDIPEEIGAVHISTFGSVLLHFRDPFLALQKAGAITTETMIVTDLIWPPDVKPKSIDRLPDVAFYPDADSDQPDQSETWWHFSPRFIVRLLKILGFPKITITYHQQKYGLSVETSKLYNLYTVVGNRS